MVFARPYLQSLIYVNRFFFFSQFTVLVHPEVNRRPHNRYYHPRPLEPVTSMLGEKKENNNSSVPSVIIFFFAHFEDVCWGHIFDTSCCFLKLSERCLQQTLSPSKVTTCTVKKKMKSCLFVFHVFFRPCSFSASKIIPTRVHVAAAKKKKTTQERGYALLAAIRFSFLFSPPFVSRQRQAAAAYTTLPTCTRRRACDRLFVSVVVVVKIVLFYVHSLVLFFIVDTRPYKGSSFPPIVFWQ